MGGLREERAGTSGMFAMAAATEDPVGLAQACGRGRAESVKPA